MAMTPKLSNVTNCSRFTTSHHTDQDVFYENYGLVDNYNLEFDACGAKYEAETDADT